MSKLAILGGKKAASELKIPRWPIADKSDEKMVLDVLRRGNWCRLYPNSWAEKFERIYAKWIGTKHAVAVANGTVSLELSLRAGGVRIGDEVLVPAVTFIASASAISDVGAIPIFVDSDPETLQISPKALEASITKRTKAVIVVNYGGYPVDLDKIIPIVRKHKLLLIQDCAHAHGTEWKGRQVGSYGDFSSFSFQGSKSLACGDGGIVLTNNKDLYEKASLVHNIGRVIGKPGYIHYILSSNYRLSEFQAGILLSQFRRLPQQTNYKYQMGEFLAKELQKIGGVDPLPRDKRITKRGYYSFIVKYDSRQFAGVHRDIFLKALDAEGVYFGAGYGVPLYKNDAFRKSQIEKVLPSRVLGKLPDYEKIYLPVAENFCANQQMTLWHPALLMPRTEIQRIIDAIVKIKENLDELKKVTNIK
ncbi:MAG: DegT/DnrJ/EryC1/StrS family aminotransferase [Elusimicrobia bacterium]|nr:DegT/DnrJ/EryC1/StrS family aminotransferase [Elusimicrobiota bacterium]